MARSVLKSLFLYFAFSVSARVFAAPAHQHQTEHHPRGVVLQEDQLLSNPRAAAPNAIVGGQHSRKDNTAVGKRVTNAMRIANGLPPLVPRRLYDGSRAGSALKARTSPLPPVPVPAILVYGSDGRSGNLLGYLSQGYYSTSGRYYLSTDCTKAMVNAQLFLGDLTNPAQSQGYPNVGILPGGNQQNSFGTTDLGYISGMAAGPSGPAVQNPSHSIASGINWYTESKVWSLGANNELFVAWINPNGETVPLEKTYLDSSKVVMVNPSLSTYRINHNKNEAQVPTLRFFVADSLTCPSLPI